MIRRMPRGRRLKLLAIAAFLMVAVVFLYVAWFRLKPFLTHRLLAVITKKWDVLIFMQQWPVSYCSEWRERNPDRNSCNFPPDKSSWTIHGIWPTLYGTKGPAFCGYGPEFNESHVEPLKEDLLRLWTQIQAGSSPYNFWKHQWEKHGRCAAEIQTLNETHAYFKRGLIWMAAYNARDLLASSGLHPGNEAGSRISEYWNAIVRRLGRNPIVKCKRNDATGNYALLEVGICFAKDLTLVDCDAAVTYRQGGMNLKNCPYNEDVFYPKFS